jgi:hypothetical protein
MTFTRSRKRPCTRSVGISESSFTDDLIHRQISFRLGKANRQSRVSATEAQCLVTVRKGLGGAPCGAHSHAQGPRRRSLRYTETDIESGAEREWSTNAWDLAIRWIYTENLPTRRHARATERIAHHQMLSLQKSWTRSPHRCLRFSSTRFSSTNYYCSPHRCHFVVAQGFAILFGPPGARAFLSVVTTCSQGAS